MHSVDRARTHQKLDHLGLDRSAKQQNQRPLRKLSTVFSSGSLADFLFALEKPLTWEACNKKPRTPCYTYTAPERPVQPGSWLRQSTR
ncbi:hypothetical protein CEP53_008369 [Fusarium sp. AF-6]|nr:hypothetical protein CEP53_008369 [Fusarium sp. AF-6]